MLKNAFFRSTLMSLIFLSTTSCFAEDPDGAYSSEPSAIEYSQPAGTSEISSWQNVHRGNLVYYTGPTPAEQHIAEIEYIYAYRNGNGVIFQFKRSSYSESEPNRVQVASSGISIFPEVARFRGYEKGQPYTLQSGDVTPDPFGTVTETSASIAAIFSNGGALIEISQLDESIGPAGGRNTYTHFKMLE